MSIKIKTHLDAGIYASCGGGETRTHYRYTTGPRNLLRAVRTLQEHRAAMIRSYGNVGCGGTWLEIDGVVIHDGWLDDVRTMAAARGILSNPAAYSPAAMAVILDAAEADRTDV